jgi:DNA-binding PadR family transcriptional regulator
MALGTLARHGPRHGHEIRRIAEVTNVGEWGGVSVGALYRELRAMEAEGLIEALRTEKIGRRPARTVYAITGAGHVELTMLREQAIRNVHWGPDPLGVALSFAGAIADREELASWLRGRREVMALTARELAQDRERLVAKGYLGPLEAAVMYRGQLHVETEVRWHDEVADIVAALPPTDPADPAGPAGLAPGTAVSAVPRAAGGSAPPPPAKSAPPTATPSAGTVSPSAGTVSPSAGPAVAPGDLAPGGVLGKGARRDPGRGS